jgi:hypothetical protein
LRTALMAHRHPLYPLFWRRRALGRKQPIDLHRPSKGDRLALAAGQGAGPADYVLAESGDGGGADHGAGGGAVISYRVFRDRGDGRNSQR